MSRSIISASGAGCEWHRTLRRRRRSESLAARAAGVGPGALYRYRAQWRLPFFVSAKYQSYDTVHALALAQHAVFSAEQATKAGVPWSSLTTMTQRGHLERLGTGLYRDKAAPEDQWTPYMRAVLWPYAKPGVLSHETALALLDLSDANPSTVHVTVPRRFRSRRAPPPGIMVHRADITETEVTAVEGLPTTTAMRTIRDCAQANIGPALLHQALEDARRKGWLTLEESHVLRAELETAHKL